MSVIGGLSTAVGLVVSRSFIGTAAEFEKYGIILSRLEGSKEKGKKAMSWVSNFAANTPYQLGQVNDAFVKLRAYGMKPIDGNLLRTLGDTSAAMGKDLMQAVEAVADAVTGENERLKEFGIKARSVGNKIVYEYSSNGKTMRKIAQKGNREMIQGTLQAIWNEKYGGAMNDLSKSWGGMTSNLMDWWTKFKKMVMDSGPFELLKSKLKAFLDRIKNMANSGELQKIAETIGKKIVKGVHAAKDALLSIKNVFNELKTALKPLISFIGGLVERFGAAKVIMTAIGVLIGSKLIVALAALTSAFITLGTVMLTTPIGWIAAAIAGVVTVGVLLYKNWEKITESLKSFGKFVLSMNPFAIILNSVNSLIKALSGFNVLGAIKAKLQGFLPDWAQSLLGIKKAAGAVNVAAKPVAAPLSAQTKVGGTLKIKIDSEGRPHVREVTTENRSVPVTVDAGMVMAGAS